MLVKSASILPNGTQAMAPTNTMRSHCNIESISIDMPRLRPTMMPMISIASTHRSNQFKPRSIVFIIQPDGQSKVTGRLIAAAPDCQSQMFPAAGRIQAALKLEHGQPCPRQPYRMTQTRGNVCPRSDLEWALAERSRMSRALPMTQRFSCLVLLGVRDQRSSELAAGRCQDLGQLGVWDLKFSPK